MKKIMLVLIFILVLTTAKYANTDPLPLQITTDQLPTATMNLPYVTTFAASGGTPPNSWSVESGILPAGLVLNSDFGFIDGTPTESGVFTFIIVARDQNSTSFAKVFSLTVDPPRIIAPVITTIALPAALKDQPYLHTLQANNGEPPYTWSLKPGSGTLPPGLVLSSNGLIYGTPLASGEYSFTVKATDNLGISSEKKFNQVVVIATSGTLTIITTPEELPAAYKSKYLTTTLMASGGNPPYIWTIASGNLPNGLSFSANGVLSGTPTESGNLDLTVRATDSTGISAVKKFSLTVIDSGPPPAAEITIYTENLATATRFGSYSAPLQAGGGKSSYTWSMKSGNLPAGLTLSNSGTISGRPTESGIFTFIVKVTDNSDTLIFAEKEFTLAVASAVIPTITTPGLPPAVQGNSYSKTLQVTGGDTSYVWSLVNGSLPAGLFLSSGGTISGTPASSGNFNFTLKATDSMGFSSTKDFNLSIAMLLPDSPTITTTSLKSATLGVPYSSSLQATDGSGNYTWSIYAYNLPEDLSLNSNGTITGTPTASGTFYFTVKVIDNKTNLSSYKSFDLVVTALPTIADQNPLPGSTNHPVDREIWIKFSGFLDSATVSKSSVYLAKANSTGAIAALTYYYPVENKVYLIPDAPLEYQTKYQVLVTGKVKDSAGNFLTPASWEFTTTAKLLTINAFSPGVNQANVAVDANINLGFSAPVALETVNHRNIYIQELKSKMFVPVTFTYFNNTNHLIIRPTGSWLKDTTYTVTLTTGINDVNGNSLNPATWNFTSAGETKQYPAIIVAGLEIKFTDAKPITNNDRTLIPFRTLFEALGAQVGFDNSDSQKQKVWAELGNNHVELIIGENKAYKNGNEQLLDVAPVIVNNRTMIPVRFAAEALGLQVYWDNQINTIYIK